MSQACQFLKSCQLVCLQGWLTLANYPPKPCNTTKLSIRLTLKPRLETPWEGLVIGQLLPCSGLCRCCLLASKPISVSAWQSLQECQVKRFIVLSDSTQFQITIWIIFLIAYKSFCELSQPKSTEWASLRKYFLFPFLRRDGERGEKQTKNWYIALKCSFCLWYWKFKNSEMSLKENTFSPF